MPAQPGRQETLNLVVGQADEQRLDRYIADHAGDLTRSQLKQRLVSVSVNGKAAKLSSLVGPGDQVALVLAAAPSLELSAEDLKLDIIFENEDVIVINKAAGMVVHPAAGNHSGTLVHGLLFHFQELQEQDFDDENRPGIVHRLDKDTSGVLIVAKHPVAHEFLARQFQERSTKKRYLSIGYGKTRFETRRVEGFLRRDPAMRQRYAYDGSQGKAACTDFTMLANRGDYCALLAQPLTGRTHQIRVHAKYIGLPLVGDPLYGKPPKPGDPRLMLHALSLEICLPGETQSRLFRAPIPADMAGLAEGLGFMPALLRC